MEKIKKTTEYFVGTHDFAGFMTQGSSQKTTVRTVNFLSAKAHDDIIEFEINANAYLYNMVRILTGTLIAVAEGKISPEDIDAITEARDRSMAGITVPPQGLYLNKVVYK